MDKHKAGNILGRTAVGCFMVAASAFGALAIDNIAEQRGGDFIPDHYETPIEVAGHITGLGGIVQLETSKHLKKEDGPDNDGPDGMA